MGVIILRRINVAINAAINAASVKIDIVLHIIRPGKKDCGGGGQLMSMLSSGIFINIPSRSLVTLIWHPSRDLNKHNDMNENKREPGRRSQGWEGGAVRTNIYLHTPDGLDTNRRYCLLTLDCRRD